MKKQYIHPRSEVMPYAATQCVCGSRVMQVNQQNGDPHVKPAGNGR